MPTALEKMQARLKSLSDAMLATVHEQMAGLELTEFNAERFDSARAHRLARIEVSKELTRRGFHYCYSCSAWGRHEDATCKR